MRTDFVLKYPEFFIIDFLDYDFALYDSVTNDMHKIVLCMIIMIFIHSICVYVKAFLPHLNLKYVKAYRKIFYMHPISYVDGMYQLFLSLLVIRSTRFRCPYIKPIPSHMSLKHVKTLPQEQQSTQTSISLFHLLYIQQMFNYPACSWREWLNEDVL